MSIFDTTHEVKNEDISAIANELELEIIELEDKIAPRDWNIYALLSVD